MRRLLVGPRSNNGQPTSGASRAAPPRDDCTARIFTNMRVAKRLQHSKVYNEEELAILNLYLVKDKIMEPTDSEEEIVDVRDQERTLDLPDLDGNLHTAQINWLQHLSGSYYTAGITYISMDDWRGGSQIWMLKLDKEKGFVPMFDTSKWEPEK